MRELESLWDFSWREK